jgi:4'-phosphopantetheinyl transferase
MNRLRLAMAPDAPRVIWLDGDDAAQSQLHSLEIDADHVASLAWRGSVHTIARSTLAGGF